MSPQLVYMKTWFKICFQVHFLSTQITFLISSIIVQITFFSRLCRLNFLNLHLREIFPIFTSFFCLSITSMVTIVHKTEKFFLEQFVIKYQEQVPELLSILQRKMDVAEFGLGFNWRWRVKIVGCSYYSCSALSSTASFLLLCSFLYGEIFKWLCRKSCTTFRCITRPNIFISSGDEFLKTERQVGLELDCPASLYLKIELSRILPKLKGSMNVYINIWI